MWAPVSATRLQAVTTSTPGMVVHRVTAFSKGPMHFSICRSTSAIFLFERLKVIEQLFQQKAMMVSNTAF
jgi:hypothetical protein